MKQTLEKIPGVVVAVIEGSDSNGRPLVRWERERRSARPARSAWLGFEPDWAACKGLRVVVGFEDGEDTKPVVLGLLDPPPALREAHTDPAAARARPSRKAKVLRVDAEEELILECGKSRISLRADGRVVILGGYVLSRSTGVNKIKGGSVEIN